MRDAIWMFALSLAFPCHVACADGPILGEQVNAFQVRLGLRISAVAGPCRNIRCGFPFPLDWPEQKITIVKKESVGPIRGISIRDVGGGVRQARFFVSKLAKGDSAEMVYTIRVERRSLAPPEHTKELVAAERIDAKLRPFLGPSPYIETEDPAVVAEANRLDLTPFENDWARVNAIREHTHRRVEYTGVRKLQGAVLGLLQGGDCEERTSVFVALCRLKGIPARSVWMPGHAYAEFYLLDRQGKGHWYPSESVGGQFGRQKDDYLILQKGDRFRDPLKRGLQRYLTETATGVLGRDGAPPAIRPIRERIDRSGNRQPLN